MDIPDYWTKNPEKLLKELASSREGLTRDEAERRVNEYGNNELKESVPLSRLRVLWSQLRNPLLLMVLMIFAAHMLQGRPPTETLLFAIALAVGLSPELLPAILSGNLSSGAQTMAKEGVLVRHLSAIENLGSMDVLCTDKTGTLTEGVVRVEGAHDPNGQASPDVLHLAALNAELESGLANRLDDAILEAQKSDLTDCVKLGEIPFDFVRKRLSIVVRKQGTARLITKGAYTHVLEVCAHVKGGVPLDDSAKGSLQNRFDLWSGRGIRVVAVAERAIKERETYSRADEQALIFVGFIAFLDRPKDGAAQAIADLAHLGVTVKLITGDHRLAAQHVAHTVGMRTDRVLTGEDLDNLRDEALWHAAENTDLFVEVDPNQKGTHHSLAQENEPRRGLPRRWRK